VIRRQGVSQTDRLVQRFFVIGGLEFSAHAHSLPVYGHTLSASPTGC
jgi:hypothetical protein